MSKKKKVIVNFNSDLPKYESMSAEITIKVKQTTVQHKVINLKEKDGEGKLF